MATKSNSKTKQTTKKSDEKINNTISENEAVKDSAEDIAKLRNIVESLKAMVVDLKAQNDELVNKNSALEEDISNMAAISNETEKSNEEIKRLPDLDMDDVNRKITVYHTQEMAHNLSTYIKLSTTKRNLRKAGEVVRFSINDFEELVGIYRRFFDRGILAVSVKDIDFAELYDLPIWDDSHKTTYDSKVLKKIPSYNFDQLKEFYNNLSESSKESFLSFWLGKVYSKESGYYDVEKMGWLKNIANTSIFDVMILQMNTEAAREHKDIVLNADKIN